MTKIFKKTGVNSPLRTPYDDCMIVMDNQTNRIFQYKSLRGEEGIETSVELNLERISFDKQKESIEIRYDLVDSEITFCTHDVVNIINEQFDFAVSVYFWFG